MGAESELSDWIRSLGSPNFDARLDGAFHRFAWRGSEDDGWFVGSTVQHERNKEPVIVATIGSWKTAEKHIFRSSLSKNKQYQKQVEQCLKNQSELTDQKKREMQLSAAHEATALLSKGKSEGMHPYLAKKKIDHLYGCKIDDRPFTPDAPVLLVPNCDEHGHIVGVQKIYSDGAKYFLKGQRTKGCHHIINAGGPTEVVYVGEGLATMGSVAMATGSPCVVAFNAGNLASVIEVVQRKFPNSRIVVIGDDDVWTAGNPGREKATKAANKIGGTPVFPVFAKPEKGATDFNDLHVREGLVVVQQQLSNIEHMSGSTKQGSPSKDESVSLSITDPKNLKPSAHDLARAYICARQLICDGVLSFRYYRGDHFRHRKNRYVRIPPFDLKADVIAFLQALEEQGAKPTVNLMSNVLANIQGLTLLPSDTVMPSFLNQAETKKEQFIALKNGILDVDKLIGSEKDFLLPHTPQYFSTTCLPYDYDPDCDCPRWTEFLNEMVPPDLQLFLQEWFGYNLVHDTSQQKFVILIGMGANGKSVVLEVLRALLGSENVSAVGLEQFDPSRTFPLAATVGKLANIVGDLGELDEIAEGLLKDFVSGGVMTLEIKYKDPFEAAATARLTFASNGFPLFRDTSDGLWRRLVIVPFSRQILDPKKQDKNLTNSEWWAKSGELPGIFNWGIEGLLRLRRRGCFIEPKECLALREEFKKESNWAERFLREHCIERPGKSLTSRALFHAYTAFVKEHGERPLREGPFAREVKRLYSPPNVFLTANAQRQSDGSRAREWIGLDWIDGQPPAGDLP